MNVSCGVGSNKKLRANQGLLPGKYGDPFEQADNERMMKESMMKS